MPKHRVLITLAIAAAVVAGVGVLMFMVDPMQAAWFPQCPSHLITGYQCPGCGTSRALHALMHGHVATAWHYNAAIFFALPLITLLAAGLVAGPHSRLRRISQHPIVPITVTTAVIIWTIARNL